MSLELTMYYYVDHYSWMSVVLFVREKTQVHPHKNKRTSLLRWGAWRVGMFHYIKMDLDLTSGY